MVLIASVLVQLNRSNNAFVLIFPNSVVRNVAHHRSCIHMLHDELHNRLVRATSRVSCGKDDGFVTEPVVSSRLDFSNAVGVDSHVEVLGTRDFPADFILLVVRIRNKVIEIDRLESLAFESRLSRDFLHHRSVVHGLHRKAHFNRSLFLARVKHVDRHRFATVPVLVRDFNSENTLFTDIVLQFMLAKGRSRFFFNMLLFLLILFLVLLLGLCRCGRSKRIFAIDRPLEFIDLVIRIRHILGQVDCREGLLFVNDLRRNRLKLRRIVHRSHFECSLGRLLVASRVHHREHERFLTKPVRVRSRHRCTAILDIHNEFVVTSNRPLEFIRLVIRIMHNLGKVHHRELFLFLDLLIANLLDNCRRVIHRSHFKINLLRSSCTFRVRHIEADLFRTVPVLVRSRHNQLLLGIDRCLESAGLGNFDLERTRRMIRVRDELGQVNRFKVFLFLDCLSKNRSDNRSVVHRFHNEIDSLGIRSTIRILHSEHDIAFTMPVRVGNIDVGKATLVNYDTERILYGFLVFFVIILLTLLLILLALLDRLCFRLQHLHCPRKLFHGIIRVTNELAQVNILELALFTNSLRRDISQNRRIVHRNNFKRNGLRSLSAIRVAHFENHHFRSAPEILVRSHHRKHTARRNFSLELLCTSDSPAEFIRLVIRVLHKFVKLDLLEGFLFLDLLVRDSLHERRRIVHASHFKEHLVASISAFRVRHGEREVFLTAPLLVRNRNNHSVVLADIHLEVTIARNFPLQGRCRMVRVFGESREVDRLEAAAFENRFTHRSVLRNNRGVVHRTHFEASSLACRSTVRVSCGKRDVCSTVPVLVRDNNVGDLVCINVHAELFTSRFFVILLALLLGRTLANRAYLERPLEIANLVVRILHEVSELNRLELLLFINRLIANITNEFRSIVHRKHRECHFLAIRGAIRVRHREADLFRTVPACVRRSHSHLMRCIHRHAKFLLAFDLPLEAILGMVKVFNVIVKFNRLERFLFLDSLACNFLHDRRVIHRNNRKCCSCTSLGTRRVRHRERHLFRAVPHLVRSLDRNNAGLGHIDLEVLIAGKVDLQAFKAVIRVRHEFRHVERSKFALFLDGLVGHLLNFREVVHGFHGEECRRGSLSTFRVRHRKRNFFGAIPELVRNDNLCNLLVVNFNLEFRIFLLGTCRRLARDREREFRELVIQVLHHVSKLDRLELTLFANRLRHHLLHEHRNVVHGFHSKGCGTFVASVIRVANLERQGFGTMPLRRRRSNAHVTSGIHSHLEFLVARNRPLEAVLGMVKVFNKVIKFNRLEFTLFLDRLFTNILHDRRVVDSLYSELSRSRCTSAFRVRGRKGQVFRTVPLVVRNLHRDFMGPVIDIDLEVLIARHFDLELGEVMVGIAQVVIQNERREFILFFNSLVRDLLEYRRVVHRLHIECDILLCRTAFRVGDRERSNRVTVPARVRNFNRSHMLVVNIYVERAEFRHRALVLDFDIPGEFRILVVFILDKIIKLDLRELLFFADVLVRNRTNDLRQVVHGIDRKHGFAFSRSAFRVRSLELDGFRAIPKFVRNANSGNTTRNRDLQVLGTGNSPLEHFDAVVRILHVLAKLNRSKFLLFVNCLVRDVLNKLRRVVNRLYLEQNILLCRSTSGVGHGKRHAFLAVPEFIRSGNDGRTVIIDFDLQVLVARHCPLELHRIVIRVGDIVRKGNHVELVLFVDDLVRNLLRKRRRIVHGLNRKCSGLVIATVIRVIGNKLDSCSTIPVSIRHDNRRNAVSVNRHRQIAISLRATSRNDFGIPRNLVLLMVWVIHKVIQADLCKLLAFRNHLAWNLSHHRWIVHRFDREVYGFRSRGALGVRSRKSQVFRAIPKSIRRGNFNRMVRSNIHLEGLVATDFPANLGGLVHIVGDKVIKLKLRESSTFLNRFTRNTTNLRRLVCRSRFWRRGRFVHRSCRLSLWSRCWILRKRRCCNNTSRSYQGRHGPLQFIHFRSPIPYTQSKFHCEISHTSLKTSLNIMLFCEIFSYFKNVFP